jgi:hypothetical protein
MLAPTIFPKVVAAVDAWTQTPAHEGGGDAATTRSGSNNGAAVLMVMAFVYAPLYIKTSPLSAESVTETETTTDVNDTYISLIAQYMVSGTMARVKLGTKANHEIAKQLAS